MRTRTWVVAAAGVGAAALTTTGITYTLTTGSTSAPPSVQRAAQPVQQAAPAPPAVQPAAQPVEQAAPAEAVEGGGSEGGEKHEDHDRRDGGRGHGHEEEEGRIYFNERTYSASTDGCIAAASGLGSSSFSIFNDSRKVVHVFRGFSCDNGAPVATVGPYGATNGVVTRTGRWGVFGGDGAVGSFLVTDYRDEW
ncbi:hypothetical protein ACFU7Y_14580 [Kitasatospora sp. NPDC057542]|uniref:hypothetical protein n=1 Tax=Streptomycetaceae TaxID=2062 RepID=UPI001CCAE646|nr:hypothetical protein [Streptomyces sp. LS1784]